MSGHVPGFVLALPKSVKRSGSQCELSLRQWRAISSCGNAALRPVATRTGTTMLSVKASYAKTALNAKNLAGLGAERLAEVLMELGASDASIQRRLRMELAAASGSANVAREVTKRLNAIAKARSFVEWPKIKELRADLELQQRTIAEQVAKIDATEALELMWRFLALANSVLNRCDDSSGLVGIFLAALSRISLSWRDVIDARNGRKPQQIGRKRALIIGGEYPVSNAWIGKKTTNSAPGASAWRL